VVAVFVFGGGHRDRLGDVSLFALTAGRGRFSLTVRNFLSAFSEENFLHRRAQISTLFTAENSCANFAPLVVCAQIDREEELHESIRRRDG
jgi:Fe2+ or Zn2+ uptake regulation protein